jgi:hypothetical protein
MAQLLSAPDGAAQLAPELDSEQGLAKVRSAVKPKRGPKTAAAKAEA